MNDFRHDLLVLDDEDNSPEPLMDLQTDSPTVPDSGTNRSGR